MSPKAILLWCLHIFFLLCVLLGEPSNMEDDVTRLLSNIDEHWSSFLANCTVTFDRFKVSFLWRPNFCAYLNLIDSWLLDEFYVLNWCLPFLSYDSLSLAAISFVINFCLNDSELPKICRWIYRSFFITDSPFSIFRPFLGSSIAKPSCAAELKLVPAYYLPMSGSPCNVPRLLPGFFSDNRLYGVVASPPVCLPWSAEYGVIPSGMVI